MALIIHTTYFWLLPCGYDYKANAHFHVYVDQSGCGQRLLCRTNIIVQYKFMQPDNTPHIICINESCAYNCSFTVLLFYTSAVENTEWPLSGVTCRDSNIAANWLNPTFPFWYYNYVDKLHLNATCLYGNNTDLKVHTS